MTVRATELAVTDIHSRPNVSVIVPWASNGCEHRERAWRWVKARYAATHPNWQVVEGRGGDPWCKAAAVADGLTRTDGDVLVIADADCWADNLAGAVAALSDGAPWVMPHRFVHRLNQQATNAVLGGVSPATAAARGGYDQRPYPGWPGGGVLIVRRVDYERAPFDHRFIGWGQEDASIALTLDTLIGPHLRLDADLWHLWHPPPTRLNRVTGNEAGSALWDRYRRARRHPDQMAQLVEEGRRHGNRDESPQCGSPSQVEGNACPA